MNGHSVVFAQLVQKAGYSWLFQTGFSRTRVRSQFLGNIFPLGLQTRFQPNMRYTYQYVGITMTGLVGVTHERTGLKLEARCTVELLRGCQYVLKVGIDKKLSESGDRGG